MHERQPGWPYAGWSLGQFWARFDGVMKARRLERAEFMASVHGAVAAMMDKGAGKRLQETLKELTKEEADPIEAGPVSEAKKAGVRAAMEQMEKRAKNSPQRHRGTEKK